MPDGIGKFYAKPLRVDPLIVCAASQYVVNLRGLQPLGLAEVENDCLRFASRLIAHLTLALTSGKFASATPVLHDR